MFYKENLKKALKDLNAYKKRKKQKYNFYSFDNVLKNYNFDIFFTIGTRSTGKTTALQRDIILKDFYEHGYQFVKLCRYKEERKNEYQAEWFSSIIMESLHKFDLHIEYKTGKYYINEYYKYIDKQSGEFIQSEFIKEGELIGTVIPVFAQQRYKSMNYDKVQNIIFDEFALQSDYSYEIVEIEHFKSLISTIARLRDIKIYLCGNVLSPHNPYFELFNINAMDLCEGNTYVFTDYDLYENPCRVGVEFTKAVAQNVDDIPRVLRIKNNAQAIDQDKYELPSSVIGEDDFLLYCLSHGHFDKFYEVIGILDISIDESKTIRSDNRGGYIFKKISYFIIYDLSNDRYYFISNEPKKYGLSITDETISNKKYSHYKFDLDVRNNAPMLPNDILKANKIYGDLDIYDILKEG